MSNAFDATLRRFQNASVRQSAALDDLARQAVFGVPEAREQARWLIWEIGQQAGVRPASIHELYLARGQGEVPPFTTPAMNVRVLAYDTARAVFRAATRLDVGALVLEIARSEIGYTEQRPAEYVAVVTAAALREGFEGPLFIQGDHVQVNAKKYGADAQAELGAVRALIEEELGAGFYNIDVDTSTLVDLSKSTLDEQQRVNYERAAELTKFVRDRELGRPRARGVHGGVHAHAAATGGGAIRRDQQNLRPDGDEPWRRGAARRLDRQGPARPRRAADAVPRSARAVWAGRCGAARRLDPPARGIRALPGARGDRVPPRDQLPKHRLRPPEAAGRRARRVQRVG